jgi:hypothetical protein
VSTPPRRSQQARDTATPFITFEDATHRFELPAHSKETHTCNARQSEGDEVTPTEFVESRQQPKRTRKSTPARGQRHSYATRLSQETAGTRTSVKDDLEVLRRSADGDLAVELRVAAESSATPQNAAMATRGSALRTTPHALHSPLTRSRRSSHDQRRPDACRGTRHSRARARGGGSGRAKRPQRLHAAQKEHARGVSGRLPATFTILRAKTRSQVPAGHRVTGATHRQPPEQRKRQHAFQAR